jgi:predicted MFS family arabinose efflux permease
LSPSSSPTRSRFTPAAVTLALLIALNLLNYIDRYILPGEVTLIQREFHWTDQQMGWLTTALFAVYMIAAPLTGWLGDHFRRKPLIIGGAVLWSLATLGTAWVHDYWSMFMRHALVGVGEATFGIFAPAVLADFYPERDRNRILSIFYLAIPVGAALGYLAGGEIGSLWGWRAPFFICAIPGLAVAALYGWMGSRTGARRQRPRQGDAGPRHRCRPVLNRRIPHRNLRPGHAHLRHGRHLQLDAHVPAPLRRPSVGSAGAMVGAITVVDGIAGTLVGGWIAQRWLRTNDRALYLLSFWSVALTLPCGIVVFFGPHTWIIPALLLRSSFSS